MKKLMPKVLLFAALFLATLLIITSPQKVNAAIQTITFNDATGQDRILNGQYPPELLIGEQIAGIYRLHGCNLQLKALVLPALIRDRPPLQYLLQVQLLFQLMLLTGARLIQQLRYLAQVRTQLQQQ